MTNFSKEEKTNIMLAEGLTFQEAEASWFVNTPNSEKEMSAIFSRLLKSLIR